MKKFFLVILALVFAKMGVGSPIDTNIAKQVGKVFYSSVNQVSNQKSIPDLQLVYQSVSLQKSGENKLYFYVYNIGDNGFVIISGDNNVIPILGYSTTSSFDPNNIPSGLSELFEGYEQSIEYVITNNIPATIEITKSWQDLLSGNVAIQKATASSVSPLIQTRWGQSGGNFNSQFYELYNNLCPYDTPEAKRAVTGCVATAMAQVMRYWKYPSVGMGSYSYTHSKYGVLSADFESVHYPYDSMPNELSNLNTAFQVNAIATLMYHCGVSVNMNYGVDASSSSLEEWTKGARSGEYALKTNFGYYKSKGIKKGDYTDNQWSDILKAELDSARPVLYRGTGSSGGHAFICDGYDESGNFHFNWGWKGYADGYFTLTSLNPGSSDFTNDQGAVIGIQPFNVEITPDANNILYVSTIGSGDKSGSSWENATPYLSLAMGRESNNPLKIWVKNGTYFGDTTMSTAFTVGAGNMVYGGFVGNEPAGYDLSLRDLSTNITILDGQAAQQVLFLTQSIDNTTTCDGLTIRNGRTLGAFDYGAGVMIYDNTLLMNCIIENNTTLGANAYGGGVYASGGKIINSIIQNNSSVNSSGGGGMCIKTGAKVTLINTIVSNNIGKFGAGILAWGSGEFINTDIVNNTASGNGGGLYANGAGETCVFTNCILWGNKVNTNSNQMGFTNTVATVNYCAVEGGYAGTNNINLETDNIGSDPTKYYVHFVSPTSGLYGLTDSSACIDAGNPDVSCLGSITIDISGSTRIKKNHVDIGAYEFGCVNKIAIEDNICQGEIYNLYGFNIPATSVGTFVYSKLLGVFNDCDSVLQLTLTVLPNSTSSFSIRIVGPYTWNDSVYSISGNYQQTLIAANGCDSIVKLSYTNTTSVQDFSDIEGIRVFPNPSTDYVDVQISEPFSTTCNMFLCDISGKLQIKQSLNDIETRIDISNLAKGIYFLQVKQGNELLKTVKVVKY